MQLHQEEVFKGHVKKEYFLIVLPSQAITMKNSAKDMIGSAQHFLPTRRIVIYVLRTTGKSENRSSKNYVTLNCQVRFLKNTHLMSNPWINMLGNPLL